MGVVRKAFVEMVTLEDREFACWAMALSCGHGDSSEGFSVGSLHGQNCIFWKTVLVVGDGASAIIQARDANVVSK